MLLCFRCSSETRGQLDALVASGAYSDHSEVLAAAVANLAVLEDEFRTRGRVTIEARQVQEPSDAANVANAQVLKLPSTALESEAVDSSVATAREGVERGAEAELSVVTEVPRIFQLEVMPHREPRGLAELPSDMWQHGQTVPLDRWILGQFNRLLPVKANCRALIHLFQEKGALGIALTAEQVANEALNLGDYLATIDERHQVQRDDALATAFPQRKKDSEKARARYANQFVVYQNGRGELSGLMMDLKLINVDVRRRERRIVPTHMAWQFAKLENPILDGVANGTAQKFSEDERTFLVEHILRGVPVESFAYLAILETVNGGSNTPDTIDASLRGYVDQSRVQTLSPSFLASQRSGAISRMSDLGLIERDWEGVRVKYRVTKAGERFISKYKKLRRA